MSKICAERREARKFWGYFAWKITILRQKKIIFFPILEGAPLTFKYFSNVAFRSKINKATSREMVKSKIVVTFTGTSSSKSQCGLILLWFFSLHCHRADPLGDLGPDLPYIIIMNRAINNYIAITDSLEYCLSFNFLNCRFEPPRFTPNGPMWPSFVYTFIRILRWLFRSFPFELYFYRGEILVQNFIILNVHGISVLGRFGL